jgi:hypothetical protein
MELPREMQSPLIPLPSTFWFPESAFSAPSTGCPTAGWVPERNEHIIVAQRGAELHNVMSRAALLRMISFPVNG